MKNSFKNKMLADLVASGLFEDQAKAVVARVIADPANEAMEGRWNDSTDDYPEQMYNVLFALSAKYHALAYIDEICPQHWARPMFVKK